jgi:hypothetical protein
MLLVKSMSLIQIASFSTFFYIVIYLGSVQLDSDLRVLSAYFQSLCRRSSERSAMLQLSLFFNQPIIYLVRELFARLTQISTLLNLEKPSDLLEFWGENSGHMTWRCEMKL